MVTIQLQPFLLYIKQEFVFQISLKIVKEVIEVDELNEGNLYAATGK